MDKLVGKTFRVNVTDDDIEKGKPMQYNYCPIALATNRKMSDVFGELYTKSYVRNKIMFEVETANHKHVFLIETDNYIDMFVECFDNQTLNSVIPIDIDISINSSKELKATKIFKPRTHYSCSAKLVEDVEAING